MAEEREHVTSAELARWLIVGAAILVGIGLYLGFGLDVEPVARPAALEAAP
ncbi:MAG TPA: hypothetical protein VFM14_17170 [Gemmatimonadales bacterium]|nr:hypothetical protein [Gemmatimonadales bacterium]